MILTAPKSSLGARSALRDPPDEKRHDAVPPRTRSVASGGSRATVSASDQGRAGLNRQDVTDPSLEPGVESFLGVDQFAIGEPPAFTGYQRPSRRSIVPRGFRTWRKVQSAAGRFCSISGAISFVDMPGRSWTSASAMSVFFCLGLAAASSTRRRRTSSDGAATLAPLTGVRISDSTRSTSTAIKSFRCSAELDGAMSEEQFAETLASLEVQGVVTLKNERYFLKK